MAPSQMQVLESSPFNASPAAEQLIEHRVTPTDSFFVRNHAAPPEIDAADYRFKIGGRVQRSGEWSLEQLRRFPRREVEATVQCAGNRRDDLIRVAPIPGEVPWGTTAVGNAVWSGVPLATLLEQAGPQSGSAHVAFQGFDRIEKPQGTIGFGASIPLETALTGSVLLADSMNGAPLTADHGFPLRVIVPGYIGARSVKWLERIVVQDEPSDNFYQARAYKLFSPATGPADADWEQGLMLGELSVNSAICVPGPGASVAAGPVRVAGYATAGGSRTVARVDVSADGGTSWQSAQLSDGSRWSWRLWETVVDLAPGPHTLVVRAFDSAANSQPTEPKDLWNFKGYMNNAWHRVTVQVS